MPKQLSTQTKNTQKQTPSFLTNTRQEMFESRPFVVQQQTPEKSQHTDLKASLMQKERYGHHLHSIQSGSAFTSQAVQQKRNAGTINAGVLQLMRGSHNDPDDSDYTEAIPNRRQALRLQIPKKLRKAHFEQGLSPGKTHYTSPFGKKHDVDPNSPGGRLADGKALEMDHKVDSVDIIPEVDKRAKAENLSPGSTDARHQQAHAWPSNFDLVSHDEHVAKGGRHHTGQGTKGQQQEATKLVDEVFKTPIDDNERSKRQAQHASEGHPIYALHPQYVDTPSHPAHRSSGIAPRRSSRKRKRL
ncbi:MULTISPECIES: hypothetical protein [unclassified Nostoc]|uniref:hypothetical protein n=1 Tax=unclassified Nostoc TaxID=2593658 RepID=UPI00262FF5FA|nr:hypothetical protein [Nostoc sp. S13]MDF5734749.1 hypothetical protein [Nostoc sp. S13]